MKNLKQNQLLNNLEGTVIKPIIGGKVIYTIKDGLPVDIDIKWNLWHYLLHRFHFLFKRNGYVMRETAFGIMIYTIKKGKLKNVECYTFKEIENNIELKIKYKLLKLISYEY